MRLLRLSWFRPAQSWFVGVTGTLALAATSVACTSTDNGGPGPTDGAVADAALAKPDSALAMPDAAADGTAPRDGSPVDAPATDSAATDSAATDSGATDSGATDSGATDSGATDSAATDSGATDSAADAGGLVALASGFLHGDAVAVDGANVYFIAHDWIEEGGVNTEYRLMQLPKGGGTPVIRYVGAAGVGLALDDTNVYFCGTNTHTLYVPIAGGNAVDLTPTITDFGDGALGQCQGVVIDSGYIYSAGGNDPVIWRIPKTGGTPVEFAGNPTMPRAVSTVRHFYGVDGTYAYWLYQQDFEAIERAPVAGGAPSPFLSTDPDGGGALDMNLPYSNENLVVWGEYLYWARAADHTIWSLPLTGGTPNKLISASGPIAAEAQIATDGTSIYWGQQNGQSYSVEKMPIAGGSQTTVVQDPGDSNSGVGVTIAVDDTSFYWLSIGSAFTTLYKVPK